MVEINLIRSPFRAPVNERYLTAKCPYCGRVCKPGFTVHIGGGLCHLEPTSCEHFMYVYGDEHTSYALFCSESEA
jgi:hypothetical protein